MNVSLAQEYNRSLSRKTTMKPLSTVQIGLSLVDS